MSIVRARLQSYRLPLRDPWPSAEGDITERRGWILALEDDQGRMGLGEAAPFPGFGLETCASAGAALRLALKHLMGMESGAYAEAIVNLPKLAPVAAAPTARAAIDLALHDLQAQHQGLPLAHYFNSTARAARSLQDQTEVAHLLRDEEALVALWRETAATRVTDDDGPRANVPVNATIPRVNPERVADLGARAVANGFETLKLKVGGAPIGEDKARLGALRDAVGPNVRIRVDANQAWTPDEAIAALRSFTAFELEYAEQPVAAEDYDGLARVRRESGVAIAVDESVKGVVSAVKLMFQQSTDIMILKPMALGGLHAARRVHFHADVFPVVVTSLLDSVVGRTAALHFAASFGKTPHAHGIATGHALRQDLADGPFQSRGLVQVPDGPGLGVRLPDSFWDGAHVVEEE